MTVFRLMDTEQVINEVKTRECLWNPSNECYKNRIDKYKAWEEVSEVVFPKFATCDDFEKSRIVRAVQSRWKTARDAYMKCRLSDSKKPTYKSRQHRYIYQDQLRFLEQVKDIDEGKVRDEDENSISFVSETSNSFVGETSVGLSTFTISNDDDVEASDEDMDFDIDIHDDFKEKIEDNAAVVEVVNVKDVKEEECLPRTSTQVNDHIDPIALIDTPNASTKRTLNTQPRKLKSKMTEFEIRLLKLLRLKNNASPNTSPLKDDDQFFFNSLAPLINNFNDHQKLKFRSKVLEVIMEVGNIGRVNVKQEKETNGSVDLDYTKN